MISHIKFTFTIWKLVSFLNNVNCYAYNVKTFSKVIDRKR